MASARRELIQWNGTARLVAETYVRLGETEKHTSGSLRLPQAADTETAASDDESSAIEKNLLGR